MLQRRFPHGLDHTLKIWLGALAMTLVLSPCWPAQAADNVAAAKETAASAPAPPSKAAYAQPKAEATKTASATVANAKRWKHVPPSSLADEVALLEAKLARQDELLSAQQKQIEKLTASLEEQRRFLEQKLGKEEVKLTALPSVGEYASLAPAIAAPALPAPLASPMPSAAASPGLAPAVAQDSQNYAQKVDALSKALAGLSNGLGGFRINGSFLLRADGIFRSANSVSSAQQNARGRYQLRLNIDRDINDKLGFHLELGSGTFNNPLTALSDFTGVDSHGPILLLEAWADYHPNSKFDFKVGKVPEVFFDDSRYLFDEDARFNGANASYRLDLADNLLGITSIEARTGQYVLTNPNIQVLPSLASCTSADPPANCVFINTSNPNAGFTPGGKVRAANLFDEGLIFRGKFQERWSHHLVANYEFYRNPEELQLALTSTGAAILIGSGMGVTLSGPPPATGNATTTKGGAFLNAGGFQVAHLDYGLDYTGWTLHGRALPLHLDFHGSRNTAASLVPWGFAGIVTLGQTERRGDTVFQYGYYYKGANSMPAGVTDDQVGTLSNVNIRTHMIRVGVALNKYVVWQNRLYVQNEISGNNPELNFFVPVPKGTALQFRAQSDLLFRF
jgi:hypothetical protein